MSYQLSIAWKASLTRTPPPICTSALGSQTALIWRAVGVANATRCTPSKNPDNPWIDVAERVCGCVASLQSRGAKASFWIRAQNRARDKTHHALKKFS